MADTESYRTAEELAANQREISVAEFFEQNRQMLGFGSRARALVTAVKEGVDNAIDAAEESGILPEVTVTITETDDGYYSLTITDNGPGITKENVPKVFGKLLYGSRFARRVQSRGQQGIGISAAVMYGQQTTGKPAEVISQTASKDNAQYFKVGIDTDSNEPEIRDSQTVDWPHDSESGTSITIYLDASFRSRASLHTYIEHTAIVNPHATIILDEPKKKARYGRTVDELPTQPTEIKPHPHGIEFGTLQSLLEVTDSHSISGFLQREFTRVGETTATDIINEFMDRIDGRYFKWKVPTRDTELPREQIESGTPTPIHTPENQDTGENSDTELESTEDPEQDSVRFDEYVTEHVNRKSEDVTNTFVTKIIDTLREQDPVSRQTTRQVVEEAANETETAYDATVGKTVREKTETAVWEFIRTTRLETLYNHVQEETSERKTDADVTGFTEVLCTLLDENAGSRDAIPRTEFHDLVEKTAAQSTSKIENSFGETAQANVFFGLWETMESSRADPPLLRKVRDDRTLADHLHYAMKDVDVMAPPSHCLSPIGEENLVEGMKKVYQADFFAASTRDASVHSGDPFLVEAGVAYGGSLDPEGSIELLRFANRVPLVYKQGGCAITNVINDIRWNNYKLSDKGSGLPQGPVAIVVHVASTNVPFTSESKDAVASVDVIKDEIERAVRDAALEMKKHLKEQRKLQKRRRKQDKIAELLPAFASKISAIEGRDQPNIDKSLARIMNNLYVNIAAETENDDAELEVVNFNNRSGFTPEINVHVSEKPACESLELRVTQTDDEWVITWQPDISAGDTRTVTLPVTLSEISELTVVEVPEEKLVTAQ